MSVDGQLINVTQRGSPSDANVYDFSASVARTDGPIWEHLQVLHVTTRCALADKWLGLEVDAAPPNFWFVYPTNGATLYEKYARVIVQSEWISTGTVELAVNAPPFTNAIRSGVDWYRWVELSTNNGGTNTISAVLTDNRGRLQTNSVTVCLAPGNDGDNRDGDDFPDWTDPWPDDPDNPPTTGNPPAIIPPGTPGADGDNDGVPPGSDPDDGDPNNFGQPIVITYPRGGEVFR